MRKIIFAVVLLVSLVFSGKAQDKYFTREGKISFFSHTSMEDIEAHNNKVVSVLDEKTGALEFAVLMKAFKFKKALMEEHFNENYVESTTYPKASFKGKIVNISSVNFKKDGEYEVDIQGDLTMKDVTKPVNTKAKIIVKNGLPQGIAEFKIKPADYKIEIPSVVKNKIAEEIAVKVDMVYQVLNK